MVKLPASLLYPWDFTFPGELSKTDAANAEPAHIPARTAAQTTTVMLAHRELRDFHRFVD